MELQFSLLQILTTFFLVAAVLLRAWKKLKNSSNQNSPPGPWKLPLIGNLHQVVGDLPQYRLRDLTDKYGPVMSLKLGQLSTVVISSPEAAREVMKTHDAIFADRPFVLCPSIITYNASDIAFGRYGDCWREMRKILLTELLSTKRVVSFRATREQEVASLVKSVAAKEGSAFNLSDMLFTLTNCIIAKNIFGKSWKHEDAFKPLVHRIVDDLGGFTLIDMFPSRVFKLLHKLTGIEERVWAVHHEANKLLQDVVEERAASRARGDLVCNTELKDIVDVFLDLKDQPDLPFPFTTEHIKGAIMDICVAGSESSATLLEWSMSELVKNPRVMKKAQEEVRKPLNRKGCIDESDLPDFKYLKLVLKEALRCRPPGPLLLPRESREHAQISGYDIPAKTKIIINGWAMARDPRYWDEPEKFYPERFLESSVDYKGMDFEFLPFGSGRRICPGIGYAMTVVEIALSNLLGHFDWSLPDGMKPEDMDMAETFGLAARRQKDLRLVAVPYRPLCVAS